jgi:hypothetical protein
MKNLCRRGVMAISGAALLASTLSLPGCEHALFATDDKDVQQKLSYFDDASSARADREARRQNANIGFGYPTGPGSQ